MFDNLDTGPTNTYITLSVCSDIFMYYFPSCNFETGEIIQCAMIATWGLLFDNDDRLSLITCISRVYAL